MEFDQYKFRPVGKIYITSNFKYSKLEIFLSYRGEKPERNFTKHNNICEVTTSSLCYKNKEGSIT